MQTTDVFRSPGDLPVGLGAVRAQTLASSTFWPIDSPDVPVDDGSLVFVVVSAGDPTRVLRCVESLTADARVLVVDSGPGQLDLLRSVGGRNVEVVRRQWTGDFAAARNFAVDQLENGWVAFVDDDEFLLPGHAQRVVDAARALERHPLRDRIIGGVTVLDQTAGVTPFLPRLFRVRGAVRWSGRLHEVPVLRADGQVERVALDVTVAHDGYETEVAERRRRNTTIIEGWRAEDGPEGRRLLAHAQELAAESESPERRQVLQDAIASGSLSLEEELGARLSLLVGLLLDGGPRAVLEAHEHESAARRFGEPGALELALLRARALLLFAEVECARTRALLARHLQSGSAGDPASDLAARAVDVLIELTDRLGEDSAPFRDLYGQPGGAL
ncbi:hypothetical protein GCM10009706_20660 [Curtobacterium citreum]|uniref:glycosyltransferase n=1 Tax=Curtobacterium TaxID=2034 RepID=UPI000E0A683F|nr:MULTISPECIES: glycosyltransferase [Curtobacterium]RDH98684.1 glycosyl transferase family 2 [Curtobacterium sp. AG1037]TQJ26715.1 glycosyl transferase family 2 [Curtobacterium citreum]GGL81979.1 hypothetical protein GCM10009706_20660 [Curtobacterium citreum]